MRLRSRQVSCRIGSIPFAREHRGRDRRRHMGAGAGAVGDVDGIGQAAQRQRLAPADRAASHETGGAISAVMTKRAASAALFQARSTVVGARSHGWSRMTGAVARSAYMQARRASAGRVACDMPDRVAEADWRSVGTAFKALAQARIAAAWASRSACGIRTGASAMPSTSSPCDATSGATAPGHRSGRDLVR